MSLDMGSHAVLKIFLSISLVLGFLRMVCFFFLVSQSLVAAKYLAFNDNTKKQAFAHHVLFRYCYFACFEKVLMYFYSNLPRKQEIVI